MKKSFNQLLLDGEVPTDLIKRVEKKTGINPLAVAAVQYKNKRQERLLDNAFWTFGVITIIAAFVYGGADMAHSPASTALSYALAIITCLTIAFVLAVCGNFVAKRNTRRFEKQFPDYTFDFEAFYGQLLRWANVTSLEGYSDLIIRELVYKVVLDAATELVKAEVETRLRKELDRLDPTEESGTDLVAVQEHEVNMRQAFYNTHVDALTLGYVPSDRNEFRNEAKRLIQIEANRRVPEMVAQSFGSAPIPESPGCHRGSAD